MVGGCPTGGSAISTPPYGSTIALGRHGDPRVDRGDLPVYRVMIADTPAGWVPAFVPGCLGLDESTVPLAAAPRDALVRRYA